MDKIVEKIPTWALPMLVNADPSGLTDEDIELVETGATATTCNLFAPSTTASRKRCQPYFTAVPAFGLPCDVIDSIVICNA